MLGAKMPFCGTKYTLSREELRVGRISSKSSRVGSEGRTRIMRGSLVLILRRRSSLEGRTIVGIIDEGSRFASLEDHRWTARLCQVEGVPRSCAATCGHCSKEWKKAGPSARRLFRIGCGGTTRRGRRNP